MVVVLVRCCNLHFAVILLVCILFVILLFFCWFFIFDLGWYLGLSDVCYFVGCVFLGLYLGLCKTDFCGLGLRNFLIRCGFLLFGTVVGLVLFGWFGIGLLFLVLFVCFWFRRVAWGVVRRNFVENWASRGLAWLECVFDFGGLCFDLIFCLRRFGLVLEVVLNFVFWWD